MKKKDKILTDRCAEPRETWRPLAQAGAPKKPFLGGFAVPVILVASVLVFFAAGAVQPDDEVPAADSIEMVIASEMEPLPPSLTDASPSVVSRWENDRLSADEADDPHALDAAGEGVAAYVSRSYRVPLEEARQMVGWSLEVGAGLDVDPLLILAVVGTESSFNPKAKSKAGAEGLMQVMTKVHQEKFKAFGGRSAAFEPYPNMVVGTSILKSLINRTGSVTKALKWYSGAANHKTDYGYGVKVLQERSRLLVAASGDSNGAVKLLRTKQSGPSYRKNVVVASLDYSHWADVSEKARDASDDLHDEASASAPLAVREPVRSDPASEKKRVAETKLDSAKGKKSEAVKVN